MRAMRAMALYIKPPGKPRLPGGECVKEKKTKSLLRLQRRHPALSTFATIPASVCSHIYSLPVVFVGI